MILHLAWVFFCIISASFIFQTKKIQIEQNRDLNIDGLRYVLAAFVVFHHNDISTAYFETGKWALHDPTLGYMGQFGVAVFFMITGYLFGDIKKETNWKSFFIKRFFRIVPLTYVTSLICIAIASYIGIKMGDTPDFSNVIYWLDGGLSGTKPAIYGFKDSQFIGAAVMWTLYWEWLFYLALPLLCLFFNRTYTIGLCIAVISIFAHTSGFFKIPNQHATLLIFFATGVLIKNLKYKTFPSSIFKSAIAVVVLTYCLFISNERTAYSFTSCIFIGIFFYLVATGGNLFGLLKQRGFVILGDASYSIYLLHGIAWFVMNKVVFHYSLQNQKLTYYVIQTFVWYGICFISLISYKYIEKPFIALGKKVSSRQEATFNKAR
ncbi:acyltransferase family protein [Pantoea endophytica]